MRVSLSSSSPDTSHVTGAIVCLDIVTLSSRILVSLLSGLLFYWFDIQFVIIAFACVGGVFGAVFSTYIHVPHELDNTPMS